MLSVDMLSVVMLCVNMLSVIMLTVVMLSVIMLASRHTRTTLLLQKLLNLKQVLNKDRNAAFIRVHEPLLYTLFTAVINSVWE